MKKPLYIKLKSSRGASLSVALLLFMVCAVMGSVILISGTVASGRLANLAQSDARYYSVTSAADLIKDSIDGKSVTLKRIRTTTDTKVYELQDNEMVQDMDNSGSVVTYDINNEPYQNMFYQSDDPSFSTSPTNTVLVDAAKSLIFQGRTSEQYWDSEPGMTSDITTTNVLSFSGDSGSEDAPADSVNLKETVKKNGDLVFTVSSTDGQFSIQMTFSLTTRTSSSTDTERTNTVLQKDMDADGYITAFREKDETVATTTKTSVLTWTLTEMKKVGM